MAVPLLLIGGAVSVASTLMSNEARAKQEAQNAWFYRKQGEFARAAARREMDISDIKYAQLKGQQISALAKGGVDVGSGSAAGIMATTAARALEAAQAIQLKGELDATLAFARGDSAQQLSDTYSSPMYNLLTGFSAAAPALNQYAASGT